MAGHQWSVVIREGVTERKTVSAHPPPGCFEIAPFLIIVRVWTCKFPLAAQLPLHSSRYIRNYVFVSMGINCHNWVSSFKSGKTQTLWELWGLLLFLEGWKPFLETSNQGSFQWIHCSWKTDEEDIKFSLKYSRGRAFLTSLHLNPFLTDIKLIHTQDEILQIDLRQNYSLWPNDWCWKRFIVQFLSHRK